MDIVIPLPFAILAALITLVMGYLIALIGTDDRHRRLADKREQQIRAEYSHYKGEVRQHFSQSSRLFSQVTEQYRQLYQHMSQGARLFAGIPATPIQKTLETEHRSAARSRRTKAEPSLTQPAQENAVTELHDSAKQLGKQLNPSKAAQPKPVKANTGS